VGPDVFGFGVGERLPVEPVEDEEEWSIKLAVGNLAAFGGKQTGHFIDYAKAQPTELPCHVIFTARAYTDEAYEDEEEAYEDGAREYSLFVHFEGLELPLEKHPYNDAQFQESLAALLDEVGLPPESGDVEFSEQGAQSPGIAHLEVTPDYAARIRARYHQG
jgi:hypothetical protein